MSRSPDSSGHPGTRRPVNLQKLNGQTGEIVWSRWLRPPFWTFQRSNPDGYITSGPTTANVEPIHGTNDVIVRLVRTNSGVPPCIHALARVGIHGSVKWWLHHHLGATGPFGLPLVPLTGMASNAATSPGFTTVSALSSSGANNNNVLYNVSAAGVLTGSTETGLAIQSPFVVQSIPGAAVLLSYRAGDQNTSSSAFNSIIQNLSVGGGTRKWLSSLTLATPLAVDSSFIVTAEQWYRGLNGSGDDQGTHGGVGKTQGIVLRDITGNYSDGPFPNPFFPPPQTDVQASLMEPACHTGDVYWRANKAATDGTRIYLAADRVTITTWYGGETNPDESPSQRFVCFNTSLSENWNIALGGIWGLLADADGVIVGRSNSVSTGPFPRVNQIERRDHDGNVLWRQAVGDSNDPSDMCFAEDGYLYVACGGLLRF